MLPALLLVLAAHAHYPHDISAWVVPLPSGGILTTVNRTEAWMVARSTNDLDFVYRYMFNGVENPSYWPHTAVLTPTGRLLMGTTGLGLWMSDDQGDTFTANASILPGATVQKIVVREDGTLLAVGSNHIWSSSDDGVTWDRAYDASSFTFVGLDALGDRACALDIHGNVVCLGSEGWEGRANLDVNALTIALGEGSRVWVGAEEGLQRSDDDGWTFTPDATFTDEPIPVIEEFDAGLVLATTGMEAVWRSGDAGLTWTYQHEGIEEPEAGQPGDDIHYFGLSRADNGSIYLASWEGPVRSDDGGLTWNPVETETIGNLRSVTLSRGEDGLVILEGSYGGGVNVVNADLGAVTLLGHGMSRPYVRYSTTTPDWAEDGFAASTSAEELFLSSDGGQRWDGSGRGQLDEVERGATSPDWAADPYLLTSGTMNDVADFAFSTDLGETWTHGIVDEDCPDGGTAAMVSWDFEEDGMAWAGCYGVGKVYETRDRGVNWHCLGTLDAAVYGIAGAPGGEKVFIGALDGLYVSEGGQTPTRTAFEGQPVFNVAISPDWPNDPTVFAIVVHDAWYRSDDGGVNWTRLDPPTADVVKSISVSPDFATDGTVAIVGYNGGWLSTDRGGSWTPIHAVELHNEDHPSWRWSEGWSSVAQDAASGGSYQAADEANAAGILTFRGIGVDLLAPTGNGAALGVSLDGGPSETVVLDGDEDSRVTVWSATDLTDTWHTLTVNANTVSAKVDAAVVWRLPLASAHDTADTGAPKERDCGCASVPSRGAWGWLALAILAGRRRRR